MQKRAARCALGRSRPGPQFPSLYSMKGTLPRAAPVCVSVAVLKTPTESMLVFCWDGLFGLCFHTAVQHPRKLGQEPRAGTQRQELRNPVGRLALP